MPSYASIIAAKFAGVKQHVQFLTKGLAGVEAKTGKLLWRYERNAKGSPAVIMTPLVSDGCVYSGAFCAGGALVRPVKKDGTFVAEEVYFNNKLPVGLGGVVKVGEYLYGSSGQSVMCVAFKTGEIKWEERALGPSSWLRRMGACICTRKMATWRCSIRRRKRTREGPLHATESSVQSRAGKSVAVPDDR